MNYKKIIDVKRFKKMISLILLIVMIYSSFSWQYITKVSAAGTTKTIHIISKDAGNTEIYKLTVEREDGKYVIKDIEGSAINPYTVLDKNNNKQFVEHMLDTYPTDIEKYDSNYGAWNDREYNSTAKTYNALLLKLLEKKSKNSELYLESASVNSSVDSTSAKISNDMLVIDMDTLDYAAPSIVMQKEIDEEGDGTISYSYNIQVGSKTFFGYFDCIEAIADNFSKLYNASMYSVVLTEYSPFSKYTLPKTFVRNSMDDQGQTVKEYLSSDNDIVDALIELSKENNAFFEIKVDDNLKADEGTLANSVTYKIISDKVGNVTYIYVCFTKLEKTYNILIGRVENDTFKRMYYTNDILSDGKRVTKENDGINILKPKNNVHNMVMLYSYTLASNKNAKVPMVAFTGDTLACYNPTTTEIELYVKENTTDEKLKLLTKLKMDKIQEFIKTSSSINVKKSVSELATENNLLVMISDYKATFSKDGEKYTLEMKGNLLHATDDEDGTNYLYYIWSKVSKNDKDSEELLGYYTSDKGTGADYDNEVSTNFSKLTNAVTSGNQRVYLNVGKYKNGINDILEIDGKATDYKGVGKHEDKKIPDEMIEDIDEGILDTITETLVLKLPVNEVFLLCDDIKFVSSIYGLGGRSVEDLFNAEFLNKEYRLQEFAEWTFKIAKTIVLFLIMIVILYTGLRYIALSQNAEQRGQIGDTLHNLIVGTIIFTSSGLLFRILMNFTRDSYETMVELANNYAGPSNTVSFNPAHGGLLGIIVGIYLDLTTMIMRKVIGWLCSANAGTELNLPQLIFKTYDSNGVSNILPYTPQEWNIYMVGYRALVGIGLAFLSIAIVRIAYKLALNATNPEKIAEEKMTMLRIFIAMMIMIAAPYLVRIVLTIFNYLVAMLPIDPDNTSFELKFNSWTWGLAGSMANAAFAWTELKIYLDLLVRKYMITVMLLATPVVVGFWAISDKTRIFTLWIGEIICNAASQFCYGLVFFIAYLLMYDGQNPMIVLAIAMLIPSFARFFKDSLQGYLQRWGQIDESAISDKTQKAIQGVVNKPKQAVKKTGAAMTFAAGKIDPDKVKSGTRHLSNIGNIMQGNLSKVQGKKDMLKNRKKIVDEDRALKQRDYANKQSALLQQQSSDQTPKEVKDSIAEVLAAEQKTPINSRANEIDEAALNARYSGEEYAVLRDYIKARQEKAKADERSNQATKEWKDFDGKGITELRAIGSKDAEKKLLKKWESERSDSGKSGKIPQNGVLVGSKALPKASETTGTQAAANTSGRSLKSFIKKNEGEQSENK